MIAVPISAGAIPPPDSVISFGPFVIRSRLSAGKAAREHGAHEEREHRERGGSRREHRDLGGPVHAQPPARAAGGAERDLVHHEVR